MRKCAKKFAHTVIKASVKKVKKKIFRKLKIWNSKDLAGLDNMINQHVDKDVKPPPAVEGHLWSMPANGSEPTVAD